MRVFLFLFLFLQYVLTNHLKIYKYISSNYRLHENITLLSSLVHGFFYTTSKMVTDLHDAERDKRQRKIFQLLDDPSQSSSKISRWKNKKNFVNKIPELMPQLSENKKPSSWLIFNRILPKITEHEKFNTLPSNYLHQTKVSTANFSLGNNHITALFFIRTSHPAIKLQRNNFSSITTLPSYHLLPSKISKNDQINKTANYHKIWSN